MSDELFERLFALLGKRSDDPSIVAFHREAGLPPPRDVMKADLAFPVEHPSDAYTIDYGAELRRVDAYPPRRENGRYVGYVVSITLNPEFAGTIAGGIKLPLSLDEATKRAVSVMKNEYIESYDLVRDNGRTARAIFWVEDEGVTFRDIRMQPDEMDEDDPRLAELRAAVPKAKRRDVPANVGPAASAPMPQLVLDLVAVQDGDGLGDGVDLELFEEFQTGGPEAWTRNAAAENEFRVFGSDGSGGLLAFWLVHAGKPLDEQPIVFLESEGQLGAVAKNLSDFVVLLGDGVGPYEVVSYGTTTGEPNDAIREIAAALPGAPGRNALHVIADANVLYADIEDRIAVLRGR